jgi:hypothetical protein
MAKNIYDLHRSAFSSVSAYVVLHEGERVANIAFKFSKDGASRLWAYVHWFGVPMCRGYAGGYGYDKQTAACSSAARAIPIDADSHVQAKFIKILARKLGNGWDRELRDSGFEVYQAV